MSMDKNQKIIKYAAICFGIFLAGAIITGGTLLISNAIKAASTKNYAQTDYEKSFAGEELSSVRVLNYDGKMRFETGEELRIEAVGVPETFGAELDNGELYVYYTKDTNWFSGTVFFRRINDFSKAEIVITLPEGITLERVQVENRSGSMRLAGFQTGELYVKNGSGSLRMEQLVAEKTELQLGSGACTAEAITTEECRVDGGSGSASMSEVTFGRTDIRTGSGSFELSGAVNGNLTLNTGSGNVTLKLANHRSEYNTEVKKASGGVWLDGEKVDNLEEMHDIAQYKLELNVGSGSVAVEFAVQ